MQLELEINQPLLAHNSQLIAAQGEAIKGFGQQRLFTWRLRPARTASPKGSPGLTATKYAGATRRLATSMAGGVRNPAERRGPTGGGDESGGGGRTSELELAGRRDGSSEPCESRLAKERARTASGVVGVGQGHRGQ
jgi:hypothetical protein